MSVDIKKLSALTTMWKTVTPIAGGFVNIPDGDYVGDLKEMKMEDSKASGRLQVVSSFEIVDGEQEGKVTKCFDGLDNPQSAGYFRNKCEVIGLDLPEDARMWQETLDAFVSDANRMDLYDITLKTSKGKDGKDYSNLYVNRISDYTKGDVAGEGEVAQKDEAAEGELTQEELDAQQAELDAQQAEADALAAQQIQQPRRVVAARPAAATVSKPAVRVAPPATRVATPARVATPVAPVGGVRRIIAKK